MIITIELWEVESHQGDPWVHFVTVVIGTFCTCCVWKAGLTVQREIIAEAVCALLSFFSDIDLI